jgi:hypothetical protein
MSDAKASAALLPKVTKRLEEGAFDPWKMREFGWILESFKQLTFGF